MALDLDPESGFLPQGPNPATVEEVGSRFVDGFPTSSTRPTIFEMWNHHRTATSSLVPILRQWLNGSFTTAKVDPQDADVVTFLPYDEVDALEAPQQILLTGLFHGKKTREACRCDSYLVVEYPAGHPAHARTEAARAQWAKVYERVRGDDTARKGFVEVA